MVDVVNAAAASLRVITVEKAVHLFSIHISNKICSSECYKFFHIWSVSQPARYIHASDKFRFIYFYYNVYCFSFH